MRVLVAFYSRTGNSERVALSLAEGLRARGVAVDVFRIRPLREYSRPLRVNPRLIADTLRGKPVELLDYGRPEPYDLVVVCSPIWIGRLPPPVVSFLVRHAGLGLKLVLVLSKELKSANYSARLSRRVEAMGHRVLRAWDVRRDELTMDVVDGVYEAARRVMG